MSVTSNIGRKSGSTSTNKFDEDSLKAAVKKSEEIAKFSPENKEFMPPLGPQQYIPAANYSAETENLSAAERSEIV